MRKRTISNILISFISQFLILVIGFVVPRLVLDHYGSDTNGLTNTIVQIFTYVALLEAGISLSTRNLLYKHIKDQDKDSICRVMTSSRSYYHKITYFYVGVVIVLSFVLPFVLKSSLGYWAIFAITLFEGLSRAITFFFIQNWNTLMVADGNNYVCANIELISKIVAYGLKIVLVLMSFDIVYVQIGFFAASLFKLLLYYIYVKKHYPWLKYDYKENLPKLKDRRAYILNELAGTIFSSTDMIILSIFLSTSFSSVYSVYNMVFIALHSLLFSIYTGISYNLGQKYVTDINDYKKTHNLYNSFFLSIITVLMICSYFLIIPFVKIYTSDITDIDYIYEWLPLLFCSIQILTWSRYISGNLTGIAGYAKQTSIISLIEALSNIVLSIIFVQIWGLYGVLLATVCSLPLKVIFTNLLCDVVIIKNNLINTLKILLSNYIIFACAVVISYFIKLDINTIIDFIKNGIIIFIVSTIVVVIVNFLANKELFKIFVDKVRRLYMENREVNCSRHSNFDLLNIIAFIMVVFLHFNNRQMGGGLLYSSGASLVYFKILESLCIVAVPIFVLKTGYFSCDKKTFNLKKIFGIFIMFFSYGILCYLMDIFIFKESLSFGTFIKCFIPNNYYINFYAVLMVISPFLNKLFDCKKKNVITLISILILCFIVFPTIVRVGLLIAGKEPNNSMSFLSTDGDVNGYTIVTFVVYYLIGAMINKYDIKFNKIWSILVYCVMTIILVLISYKVELWGYNSVFVLCSAVSLFIFFKQLNMRHNKILYCISKCSLGVFLLHTTHFFVKNYNGLFEIEKRITESLGSAIGYSLLVVFSTVMICIVIDLVLRLLVKPIKDKLYQNRFLNYNLIDLNNEELE